MNPLNLAQVECSWPSIVGQSTPASPTRPIECPTIDARPLEVSLYHQSCTSDSRPLLTRCGRCGSLWQVTRYCGCRGKSRGLETPIFRVVTEVIFLCFKCHCGTQSFFADTETGQSVQLIATDPLCRHRRLWLIPTSLTAFQTMPDRATRLLQVPVGEIIGIGTSAEVHLRHGPLYGCRCRSSM